MKDAERDIKVKEIRMACRQFALLYFHFCKTLRDTLGEEAAFSLAGKAVFELSLDRSGNARKKAAEQGLAATLENFPRVNDLPQAGWDEWRPDMGGVRCPYAETWIPCFREHPWFRKFASHYCDVIDTTNIENFTRTTSHRLVKSLLWGDDECAREYFESPEVREGKLSYDGEPRKG
jgi:hypothetical protein